MVQENNGSSMEMGTSDQVLVATKRKKNITYILGTLAMLVAAGVVVALVVLLSGNDNGTAEPIVSTTEGPTTPVTVPTQPTTTTTTTEAPIVPPEVPPAPPLLEPIDLNDVINGMFSSASFNGSWASGNDILYRTSDGDLVTYDVETNSTMLLVSNSSQILQQSSRVTQLSSDGSHVVLAYLAQPVYRYSFLARYAVIEVTSGNITDILPPDLRSEEAFLQNFVWGPSGTSLAFVYLNNIFYQPNLTSEPQQITSSGQLNVIYHGIPDWVYEEEVFGSNNAIWFSGDGNKMAYVTFDDSKVRVMRVPHYGLPGAVDYQYTRHHEIRYPKPGTTNPTVTVTLRDIESGVETVYEAPENLNQPIIKTVRFVTNETIALMWTNRGQTSLIVQTCTQGSTSCTEIFSYTEDDGWIDNIPLFFNDDGDSFITILPQAVNGVRYKQVVQISQENTNETWSLQSRSNTPHTVSEILLWTPDDIIWYKATHVNDSAEQHIYYVNDLKEVTCFSCDIKKENGQPCLYNDAQISTDATKIALNCAGPDVPQVMIFSPTGALLKLWDDNAEIATLMSSKLVPSTVRVSVPLAAGLPDADVMIQVPDGYQNRTDVPLLVYVYGGPDTALVTKAWSVEWGSSLVSRWGVAVAHIDARGSGLRGVDTMFAVNRRLGSVEIQDQIDATKYLQQTLPWVDSNRTCIWGWSYGGYAASLALARGGDVFRCAAAVAPVADWRFYDTIYTERYMDTPQNNQQAYVNSSLLTEEVVEAYRNKRYFLIHGTADDNVHYQHAMLISRLLQTSDVYFTQMSYTDEDHGLIGVRPHLYHSLEKFLKENML